MKKQLLAILLIAIIGNVHSQNAIPNPGFETWNVNPNYDDPDQWGTINGLTYFLGVRTVTKATAAADVHGGSYAIKLESKNVPLQGTAPGIAATGTINTNGYIDGGVLYNKRPISMTGWYKYTPGGTDTGSVEATLSKWNTTTHVRDEVAKATFTQNTTVGSYTQFTVNFTYVSANVPDTLVMILLTSSQGSNSPTGSKLWVDDLDFVLCHGFTATPSSTNAICTAANGTASVTTANGAGGNIYHWSNNASTASVAVAGGSYAVTVTDLNGCTATASTVVGATTVNIGAYATSTNTICTANSGTLEAGTNGGGGSDPNTYHWANNVSTFNQTNVGGGTYAVTVTDFYGCTGTASATVNTTTTTITSTINSTNTTCGANTGSAVVTPTNGTANYTYVWNNSGNTATISNLGAGGYQVTITDINGCSGTASTSVTTPNGPAATHVTTNVHCHGGNNGAINVTETGGTGAIHYLWNTTDTTKDLSNLIAGTYSLTISDVNNCSFVVSSVVTEPAALSATAVAQNVSCHAGVNGAINLTTTGGTLPVSYLWSNTDTSEDLTALSANTYTVTVTDINNCSTSASATVTEHAALTLTLTSTDASSTTAADGSVLSTVTGGTGAVIYFWNNLSTASSLINVPIGIYCVTVTDADNCVSTGCDTIAALVSAIGYVGEEPFKIYPNPVSDLLLIETNSSPNNFSFSIFDLNGKLVEEKIISGEKKSVDVKQLPVGFYSYQLQNNSSGKMNYGKLVIER